MMPYLAILGLIVLSALFSGSEIAYLSTSELRLRKAAGSGKAGQRALIIFESFEKALITILIGNNLVNISASAVATVIAIDLMGENGAWVATAVMTLLILTFGEILPKILAKRIAERFAILVSLPLYFLCLVTRPLIYLVQAFLARLSRIWADDVIENVVTEEDIETMLETVEDEGVVDEDTCDLLQSALDFDDVSAYEIITPRVDMVAVDIEDAREELVQTVLESTYSRIPVYRDTPDNIVGVLHVNRFLRALADKTPFSLEEQLMVPVFVHKTMLLPDVLSTMRERGAHLAIVTDEYGGTMGIITMEDVLERLVGDIWDEKDEIDEEFVALSDDEFEADGDMRTLDLFDELDIDERDFDDDNATLGGWAIEMLGGYPSVGDSFSYKNIQLTVQEVTGLRVRSLRVRVLPEAEEVKEDQG
ncbi:MAG: HlyC/CorC family transporter [Clostridiales bacterium]|nr:hemolysin family protein [Bacillota bacterium]NLL54618.1 HlyC/CorC family transporter [Clostridiales bacterium]